MLGATPKPSSDDYGKTDGAFAACFVSTDDPSEAEAEARALLETIGWDTDELEEVRAVIRDDYEGDATALERFDQAILDGIVITLHRWPVGAPGEADSDVDGSV